MELGKFWAVDPTRLLLEVTAPRQFRSLPLAQKVTAPLKFLQPADLTRYALPETGVISP